MCFKLWSIFAQKKVPWFPPFSNHPDKEVEDVLMVWPAASFNCCPLIGKGPLCQNWPCSIYR